MSKTYILSLWSNTLVFSIGTTGKPQRIQWRKDDAVEDDVDAVVYLNCEWEEIPSFMENIGATVVNSGSEIYKVGEEELAYLLLLVT